MILGIISERSQIVWRAPEAVAGAGYVGSIWGMQAANIQQPAVIEKSVVSEQSASAPVKGIYVPPVKEEPMQVSPEQPTFSDFGLFKCETCGKMVMGFDKEAHAREMHKGKSVEWKKMR